MISAYEHDPILKNRASNLARSQKDSEDRQRISGSGKARRNDFLHEGLVLTQDRLLFGIDIERGDLLRRRDAGIALIVMRYLNQSHIEQNLAASVQQLFQCFIEGIQLVRCGADRQRA